MNTNNQQLQQGINRVKQAWQQDPSQFFVGTGIRRAGESANNPIIKLLASLAGQVTGGVLDPEKAMLEEQAMAALSPEDRQKQELDRMLSMAMAMHGGVQAVPGAGLSFNYDIAGPMGSPARNALYEVGDSISGGSLDKARQIVKGMPANDYKAPLENILKLLTSSTRASSSKLPPGQSFGNFTELIKSVIRNNPNYTWKPGMYLK